jgi:Flp pilus assembly protein TadD
MHKSSEGRMRPDELKEYLKSLHSDQTVKPTTKTQIHSTQASLSSGTSSSKQGKASATTHTYDSYREKWDNFDVAAALQSVEDKTQSKSKLLDKSKPLKGSKNLSTPIEISPTLSKADEWKEKGNLLFKSGNYSTAIDCYTSSIEAEPTCVAYANRAMAHLKLNNYDFAIKDCTAALKLDENYVKAWLRRGAAQRELGFLESAIRDFEEALRLEPGNKSAMDDRIICIKKWIEENKNSSGRNSTSDLFSITTSVPIIAADEKNHNGSSRSKNEGLLKQISTKRVSEQEPKQLQGELIKKALVQEVVEMEEGDQPPPLPEIIMKSGSIPLKVEEMPSLKPPLPSARELQQQQQQQQQPAPPIAVSPQATTLSFKAPKTGVDFERSWRGFKGNLEQQALYLRQIDAKKLPNLLKQVLTPNLLVALQLTVLGPMLTNIIDTTEDGNYNVVDAVVAILEELPKVARFSMNVLSLSNAQKKELKAAWDKACLEFPKLNTLRSKFSV